MIVGNLALKDRVDKSEWYSGYSSLSILLRGFFNLSNERSCWRDELYRTCSGLSELNFIKKGGWNMEKMKVGIIGATGYVGKIKK